MTWTNIFTLTSWSFRHNFLWLVNWQFTFFHLKWPVSGFVNKVSQGNSTILLFQVTCENERIEIITFRPPLGIKLESCFVTFVQVVWVIQSCLVFYRVITQVFGIVLQEKLLEWFCLYQLIKCRIDWISLWINFALLNFFRPIEKNYKILETEWEVVGDLFGLCWILLWRNLKDFPEIVRKANFFTTVKHDFKWWAHLE